MTPSTCAFSSILRRSTALVAIASTFACAPAATEDEPTSGGADAVSGSDIEILATSKGGFKVTAANSSGFYVGDGEVIQRYAAGRVPEIVVRRAGALVQAVAASEDALVWWNAKDRSLHGAAIDGTNDVVVMEGSKVLCGSCRADEAIRDAMPSWMRSHFMGSPSTLAVRGKDLYFTDTSAHLYRARADEESSFEEILDLEESDTLGSRDCDVSALTADGRAVYVIEYCRAYSQLERIDLGSKARRILDSISGEGAWFGRSLVLDDDALVYQVTNIDGPEDTSGVVPQKSELRRVSIDGGAPRVVAKVDSNLAGLAALDGKYYFASQNVSAGGRTVDVLGVPAAGGTPRIVTNLAPSAGRKSVGFSADLQNVGTDGTSLFVLVDERVDDGDYRDHVLLVDTR